MKKKRFAFWMFIGITWGVLGACLYGIMIEPYQVEIHHLWIENSRLNNILEGKIAVHLSDLHMSKIGRREQKVLKILDELKPDFIFLTGDYVSWDGDYEVGLKFLSKLRAKIGVWAVMGDYDYRDSRKSCLFCHQEGSGKPTQLHPVQFLKNSFEQIKLSNGSFWIGGMDPDGDDFFLFGKQFLLNPESEPAIILSHNPLNFELLEGNQDALMLSGDTHGGQVPLPGWLWMILGYEKCARYNHGFFEEGQKKMYVSRGIGTSHFPMRIFRRPEFVVLHFK